MSLLHQIAAGALGLVGFNKPASLPAARVEPTATAPRTKRRNWATPEAAAMARASGGQGQRQPFQLYTTTSANPDVFKAARAAPGIAPEEAALAMDASVQDYIAGYGRNTGFGEDLSWLGYPYLAELTQRAEYRRIVETIAREMTRKWVKINAAGQGSKENRVQGIEAQLRKHKVRDKFRRLAELDGYFGRGHLFIDAGVDTSNRDDMKVALIQDARTFERGMLKDLVVVEPFWTYPGSYNSINPLKSDFFEPVTWYVMSRELHRTRLLTFVGREMPDMLKPAYQFGGLSMSQMAKPYIDNWLRTRQAVSDLLHSYSANVLKTDMGAVMQGEGYDGDIPNPDTRAAVFNAYRDNRGLMMLDKDTEDFVNVSTPLGTLDHLQAQAQEQMASVCGIPLVVLTGITPSGLNATSDGELEVWGQTVHALQEHLFGDHLRTIVNLIQLDQWGDIDPDITVDFQPLREESAEEEINRRKAQADTHQIYVQIGAIAPEEVREQIANDEDSVYAGLDLSAPAPGPPDVDPGEGEDSVEEGPANRASLTKTIASLLADRARTNGVGADALDPPVEVEMGPQNRVAVTKQIAAALAKVARQRGVGIEAFDVPPEPAEPGAENRVGLVKQIAAALADRANPSTIPAMDDGSKINPVSSDPVTSKPVVSKPIESRPLDAEDSGPIAELPAPFAPIQSGYRVVRGEDGALSVYAIQNGRAFSMMPGDEHQGLADGWYDDDLSPVATLD